MKDIFVVLLICSGLTIYCANAHEHNLFYGNCVHDNRTIQIYSQVIMMDNPYTNNNQPKPRKWYDWFSNISFGRKSTTTPSPNLTRKVINATVQFPPAVSKIYSKN